MECSGSSIFIIIFFSTASILTLIGSLIVILVILYQGLYFSYSFKILLFISINDLIRGILGIIMVFLKDSNIVCMIVGFMFNAVSISNYVWALCLTFTIYQIIVKEETDFKKHHKKWLLVAYPGIFLLESLPFCTSSFGLRDGFCELKIDLIGSIWRLTLYYLEVFVTLALIIFMFLKIQNKTKLMGNLSVSSIVFERGLIYTIIIAVVEIPIFVVRLTQVFYKSCDLLITLDIFLALFLLQGFANTIVFLINKTVRTTVWAKRKKFYETLGLKDTLKISFRSTIN